jgi:hypothetical protein
MYYVEFYSRKPHVDVEVFRETVRRTDALWALQNPQDRPRLAIGRTWPARPVGCANWVSPRSRPFPRPEFRTR